MNEKLVRTYRNMRRSHEIVPSPTPSESSTSVVAGNADNKGLKMSLHKSSPPRVDMEKSRIFFVSSLPPSQRYKEQNAMHGEHIRKQTYLTFRMFQPRSKLETYPEYADAKATRGKFKLTVKLDTRFDVYPN